MRRLHLSRLLGTLNLLFAATAFAGNPAGSPADADAPAPVRAIGRLGGGTERVSALVGPRVVQIVTQSLKVAGAGDEQPTGVLVAERGRGSGFFVTADGYLITNAHVVGNSTRIRVLAATPGAPDSPREFAASLIGVDPENDLALLKVEAEGLPFFDLARDATARQGQLVLAYGSPMGLAQSASLGLVSAVDRQLNSDDPRAYIQTDASMNPGNSGGPLVDLDGRLLGVNTMILSQSGGSEGLGFAIPLEVVRHTYAALRAHGFVARAQLGIQPRALTTDLIAGLDLKVRQGILVEDLDPNGPGAAAGMHAGDVLVGIGGAHIHNVRDLYRAEYALAAGVSVDLAVMRGPDMRLLEIKPAMPRKAAPALSAANVTEKDNLIFRLGVYGGALTPESAHTLGGVRGGPGVLVLALAGVSVGGENVLAPGDIVHAVNNSAVDTVESLRARLEAIGDSAPVVLQIERAGMLSYVTPGALPGAGHVKKTSTASVALQAERLPM